MSCSTLRWAFAAVLLTASTASADDEWPQFRGPNGQGHAEASGLPTTWSETENVVWKAAVPGRGHSSPVISGRKIWLTTSIETPLSDEEKKRRLSTLANPRGLELAGKLSLRALCFDRETGQPLHNLDLFEVDSPEPIHSLNSYASPTPVLEGNKVYCHFGTYGACCLDAESGRVLWKNAELKADHQNGPGSSPILWNDLLIVHFDGIDVQFVAAYDKQTGAVRWKTPRSGELNPKGEMQKAYATPLVTLVGDAPQLISPGADWLYGYDPATGKELWKARYGALGFSTVPRPVVGHGMAFICTSYMQSALLAVKLDGVGDVSQTHIAWRSDKQIPKKPSLLLLGDELYMVSDQGIAACLDAKTGEEHWRQRLGGNYSASPMYADGKIFLMNQEGQTVVVAPGKQYRELAVNTLETGAMGTPAAVGRALYLRTDSHLYRIEQKAKTDKP